MRVRALLLLVLVVCAACGGDDAPPTPPDLDRRDLQSAVLDKQRLGDGWEEKENPGPNTVQIGGTVGAANVRPVLAEATAAFDQTEGTGFLSNTLLLVRSESVARAVIATHQEAAKKTTWTQDRDDGGRASFSFDGAVQGIAALGDELFAARLKAVITNADGQSSEHAVEYVVYSVGPLLAFVVAQDVGAGEFARRLESRVANLLTSSP